MDDEYIGLCVMFARRCCTYFEVLLGQLVVDVVDTDLGSPSITTLMLVTNMV